MFRRLSSIAAFSLVVSSLAPGCSDSPADVDLGTGGGPTGTTTTSTGSQGGAAATCTVGALGSCGAGQKCSVVDPFSGEIDCVAAGSGGPFAACELDSDCQELTFCDGLTGVCKPLCDSEDDCAGDGRCVDAVLSIGEPIPGLKLCTAGCQPLTGVPCDLALGDVACAAHNPGDDVPSLDCVASQGAAEDAPCTQQSAVSSRTECAQGLSCAFVTGQGSAFCKRWCSAPGAQAECDAGETCVDTGLTHMGTPYGICP